MVKSYAGCITMWVAATDPTWPCTGGFSPPHSAFLLSRYQLFNFLYLSYICNTVVPNFIPKWPLSNMSVYVPDSLSIKMCFVGALVGSFTRSNREVLRRRLNAFLAYAWLLYIWIYALQLFLCKHLICKFVISICVTCFNLWG
jgi:hypothetical protein